MSAKGKNVVFIIAPKDFRDEELFHPMEEIGKAGAHCEIASTKLGERMGSKGGKAGVELMIDYAKVSPDNFDAIVFVGGSGAKIYFEDARAQELARNFAKEGKVVAAICIAPSILANAGVLKGKKATSFPSEKDNLISKGAKFTGAGVEVDGKIVTADGPKSAKDFGKRIAKLM